MTQKKVHWHDLTPEEQALIPNVPGTGMFTNAIGWLFKTLGLKFNNYVYSIHDFQFVRGGGVIDFMKSNIYMMLLMQCDAVEQSNIYKGLLLYFLIAPFAFVSVSTYGAFIFHWGKYRTKEEIIQVFVDYNNKKIDQVI